MKFKVSLFFLVLITTFPLSLFANDLTHVSGAPYYWEQKKEAPFGFKINLGYNYENHSASINKEYMGDGNLKVVRDLDYSRSTSTINIGAELGIKGFAFFMNLPIIFSSTTSYKFKSGSRYPGYTGYVDCITAHTPPLGTGDTAKCNPDGVNARNSRTVQDGIVRDIYDPSSLSIPDGTAGPRSLFNGPDRNGIDQLHVGFRFNVPVFNQVTDKTKPFWILSADLGIPVGEVKDFKRTFDGRPTCNGPACDDPTTQRPDLNNAVGRGIYDITLSSLMSKTDGIFNSFFQVYATLPISYTSDSLYASKYNFNGEWGMEELKAPIKGGIKFGTDFNVYKEEVKKIKINLFLRGMVKGVFQGQDYSEAYDFLAGSPMLNGVDGIHPGAGTIPALDYFTGLTTVENYMVLGLNLGINLRVTRYFFMELSYGLRHATEHFITYTDAGEDDGTSTGGKTPGTVDLNTKEANPYYRPIIDQVGKRYRIQESMIHSLLISFKLMY
jgi:hypothetical protein